MTDRRFMVFDVESIGLHGEGWAVGMVVVNEHGAIELAGHFACSPDSADGGDEGRQWVRDNCPPVYSAYKTPREVRDAFWAVWQDFKATGTLLVADCAWPVETQFLNDCVDDDLDTRAWQGPYPLHELASFMEAAGMSPMATYDRLPDEPLHDPLGDAKQSARLLVQALSILRRSE